MSQAKKSTIEKSKMAKKSEKHPPYATMIKAAIKSLDADRGSSRHAILKYITENYKITSKFVNKYVNAALKKGVQNDFVDRANMSVAVSGEYFLQYFNWGSSWRVQDDEPDTDQTM